jgi:hypothetical protein
MKNPFRPLLLVSILLLAGACSSAASTNTPAPPTASAAVGTGSASATAGTGSPAHLPGDATQTSDRAGVTVTVTWAGPATGAVFEVKMDNHMIDLSSVDLTAATLTNDRGEKLSKPTWEGGSSGHHREGKLSFGASPAGASPAGASPAGASPAGASPAALFADASWVQLELPAVGDGSPRDFKWTLSK